MKTFLLILLFLLTSCTASLYDSAPERGTEAHRVWWNENHRAPRGLPPISKEQHEFWQLPPSVQAHRNRWERIRNIERIEREYYNGMSYAPTGW